MGKSIRKRLKSNVALKWANKHLRGGGGGTIYFAVDGTLQCGEASSMKTNFYCGAI